MLIFAKKILKDTQVDERIAVKNKLKIKYLDKANDIQTCVVSISKLSFSKTAIVIVGPKSNGDLCIINFESKTLTVLSDEDLQANLKLLEIYYYESTKSVLSELTLQEDKKSLVVRTTKKMAQYIPIKVGDILYNNVRGDNHKVLAVAADGTLFIEQEEAPFKSFILRSTDNCAFANFDVELRHRFECLKN